MTSDFSTLIGKKVQIPGHFPSPVSIEAVKSIGSAVLLQVRTSDGRLEETVLTGGEVEKLLEQISQQQKEEPRVAGEELRLLIESNRIVWNPTESDYEHIPPIQDPAEKFAALVREVKVINHYEISAQAIEKICQKILSD